MSDNTILSAGVGTGDTVRDLDRAGVKTQIVGLDLGIGTGSENLMAGTMPVSATNLDVALSTRTKPADQQHAIIDSGTVTTVSALTAITNALPAGSNLLGKVTTDQTAHGTTDLVAADVTKVGGAALALGQALAAASVPVVLTAAQLTTLTPPASVTANIGTAGALALDATLTGGSQQAQGNVANGVTDAGNPVKTGGRADTNPTAVSAGQRVNLWLGLSGETVTAPRATNNDVDGCTDNVRMTLDMGGNRMVVPVQSLLWNGTNRDRQRGNTDLTLLASAARTTTQQSADQVNYNGRGVRVVLNVTVASGTGGLQVQVQGKDSISASYYQLNTTPTLVIATGTYVYDLYPTTLDAAANGITQKTQTFLPRTWRVNVAVGDASSYTYSVSGVTML